MKMTAILATAVAVAALGTTARAADTTYYDPAPQPTYNTQAPTQVNDWQGGYAGLQLGGGDVSVSGTGSDTSVVGGAHAGYNWQVGSVVFGGEVDADLSGASVAGTDVDATMHAKVRAGMAFDRVLVTGSVGYGHMWVSGAGGSGNKGGLTYGAGADYRLNDKVIVGADYLHTDINNFNGANVDENVVRGRLSYKFN